MSILGTGIDVVETIRVKKLLKKNNSFINRVFTNNEIKYCKKKNIVNCFSKRFAVKESLVKALGTGFIKNINFKDIEVKNNDLGKPIIFLSAKLRKKIKKIFKVKKFKIYLSLADEKKYAMASVIIVKI